MFRPGLQRPPPVGPHPRRRADGRVRAGRRRRRTTRPGAGLAGRRPLRRAQLGRLVGARGRAADRPRGSARDGVRPADRDRDGDPRHQGRRRTQSVSGRVRALLQRRALSLRRHRRLSAPGRPGLERARLGLGGREHRRDRRRHRRGRAGACGRDAPRRPVLGGARRGPGLLRGRHPLPSAHPPAAEASGAHRPRLPTGPVRRGHDLAARHAPHRLRPGRDRRADTDPARRGRAGAAGHGRVDDRHRRAGRRGAGPVARQPVRGPGAAADRGAADHPRRAASGPRASGRSGACRRWPRWNWRRAVSVRT